MRISEFYRARVWHSREVNKLAIEEELRKANKDDDVHGIMIYYPVFGTLSCIHISVVALERVQSSTRHMRIH